MSLRPPLENENELLSTGLSFPHAFSGTPGESRTGPPIKTFGGDGLGSRISSFAPQFSKERTKDAKDSESIFEFLNFVLFVAFVVQHLLKFWLRLRRARLFVTFVVKFSVSFPRQLPSTLRAGARSCRQRE